MNAVKAAGIFEMVFTMLYERLNIRTVFGRNPRGLNSEFDLVHTLLTHAPKEKQPR